MVGGRRTRTAPTLEATPNRLAFNEFRIDEMRMTSPATPHRIQLCAETTIEPKQPPPTNDVQTKRSKRILQYPNKQVKDVVKRSVMIKGAAETDERPRTLTDFFPVRRSVRKTKRTVLEEKQRNMEVCVRKGMEDGLMVKWFEDKGRGVIATRAFTRGDYVVEYSGELIDLAEAKRREDEYARDQTTGCYMYYFKYQNQQYCIDATAETHRLGRLVNHSRNGNLIPKAVTIDGCPHVVLLAKDCIVAGDELAYDYGDRSRESLKHHPWLAL